MSDDLRPAKKKTKEDDIPAFTSKKHAFYFVMGVSGCTAAVVFILAYLLGNRTKIAAVYGGGTFVLVLFIIVLELSGVGNKPNELKGL